MAFELNQAREWVSRNRFMLLAVVFIFVLAFAIRGQLLQYQLFFEFDSYFHARIAGEYAHGNFLTRDHTTYYYLEEGAPLKSFFFWGFSAALYNIFTLFNYSKESWITFIKFAPALYGALIAVAMYFLGRSALGHRAGVVMGFFASVVPAFVYRTMAGFFEEDALGFLWMVIGFTFWLEALKEGRFNARSVAYSVLAAFFFVLMALTWEMYMLIPLIMLFFIPATVFLVWAKRLETKEIRFYAGSMALVFVLFAATTMAIGYTNWASQLGGYISTYAPVSEKNLTRASEREIANVLGATVGEEDTGRQYFGEKYSALILFPILALLLIPWRIWKEKKLNPALVFIFFWILSTLFMAWVKLKFTYTFGLPIAAAAGVVFYYALAFMETRPSFEKKAIGVALAFLLLLGVAAGSFFVTTKVPPIEQDTGWKETLYWIRDHTPTDAKLFNWWDEGHWLAYIGERKTLLDNRNNDFIADMNVAQFVLGRNEAGESLTEEQLYSVVKHFGSDYAVFGSDLLTKQGSLQ
ncbi:MAG: glycosyltransferase family 39 protein, partial [Candidatus Diapherotrites archaeon]|nr:glycosyltransferase family 39 protein [Candidatus Diapherotrites archaeon]